MVYSRPLNSLQLRQRRSRDTWSRHSDTTVACMKDKRYVCALKCPDMFGVLKRAWTVPPLHHVFYGVLLNCALRDLYFYGYLFWVNLFGSIPRPLMCRSHFLHRALERFFFFFSIVLLPTAISVGWCILLKIFNQSLLFTDHCCLPGRAKKVLRTVLEWPSYLLITLVRIYWF